jgi:hypothetical protein
LYDFSCDEAIVILLTSAGFLQPRQMSPARVQDLPTTTASVSRKRSSISEYDVSEVKKQKMSSSDDEAALSGAAATIQGRSSIITTDEMARKGVRRGIALALNQVGFDGASEESLESFATMVDTCTPCRLVIMRRMLDN